MSSGTVKFYCLKHKPSGKLVGYETTHTDSDFSVEFIHDLSIYHTNLWVSSSFDLAKKVISRTSEYYNADYYSPINPYVNELEICEFEVSNHEVAKFLKSQYDY